MADPVFRAGGLITGLDTNTIVEQLTNLEALPLNQLRRRQTGVRSQISGIGDLVSRLKSLQDAATKLGTGGALGVNQTGTTTAFTAEPGSSATAGRYDVTVSKLATAARSTSTGFATGTTFTAGSLSINLGGGTSYSAAWANGASLSSIAAAIKDSGAPVNAVVLNDGTKDYLSITARETGHPLTQTAAASWVVSELDGGGVAANQLGLTSTLAQNAEVTINDVTFKRRSNVITDAVPGTTLTLKTQGGAQESLLLENDPTATASNLQRFVDAYNSLIGIIQRQLSPAPGSDRNSSLAGDTAVRALQRELKSLISTNVGVSSNVRSLADIGVKSNRDGTLTVDNDVLKSALGREPDSVNQVFSKATSGVSDLAKELASRYTSTVDGIFTERTKGLNSTIRTMDEQAARLQLRIDGFREKLIKQFTEMEKVVSGLRASGNYLSQQLTSNSGGNG